MSDHVLQGARLGRHARRLLTLALDRLSDCSEELVADPFEGFVRCQNFAVGVATFVGRASWFVYALDPAPHTRAGYRSEAQLRRLRQRSPQDSRGGYPGAFHRVLEALTGFYPDTESFRLITDGHPAYRSDLAEPPFCARIVHEAFPNPQRRRPETRPVWKSLAGNG